MILASRIARPIPVMRLGDCREALGARAALADGRAGGARLAALLVGERPNLAAPKVDKERAAQALPDADLCA